MFRMSTLAGLAAASMLATSAFFVGATGSIAGSPSAETAPAAFSAVETVTLAGSAPAASASVADAGTAGCTRKIKVVYAGYGEGSPACASSKP